MNVVANRCTCIVCISLSVIFSCVTVKIDSETQEIIEDIDCNEELAVRLLFIYFTNCSDNLFNFLFHLF